MTEQPPPPPDTPVKKAHIYKVVPNDPENPPPDFNPHPNDPLAPLPALPEPDAFADPPDLGHQPTDKTRGAVEVMRAGGIGPADVAAALGIKVSTLRHFYAVELATAKTKLDAEVIQQLILGVRAGSERLIEFYLKTQCGWKETSRHEFARALEDDLDKLK